MDIKSKACSVSGSSGSSAPIAFIGGKRVSMAEAANYMLANGLSVPQSSHGQYAIPFDASAGQPPLRPNRKARARAAPHVAGERCAICANTTRGAAHASATNDTKSSAAGTAAAVGTTIAGGQPLSKRPRRDMGPERKRSDRAVFAVYDAGDDDADGSAVAAAAAIEFGAAAQRIFTCWECGNAYHSQCFVPPLNVAAVAAHLPEWYCPACKACAVCKRIATATATAGAPNDSTGSAGSAELLICDMCDRGFHTACLTRNRAAVLHPTAAASNSTASAATNEVPLFLEPQIFICPDCVYCHNCSRKTPGDSPDSIWEFGSTLCEECATDFAGSACGVCNTPYDEADASSAAAMWLQCDTCDCWIHAACEAVDESGFAAISAAGTAQKYKCLRCRSGLPKLFTAPTAAAATTSTTAATLTASAAPSPPPPSSSSSSSASAAAAATNP